MLQTSEQSMSSIWRRRPRLDTKESSMDSLA
jgi:hypothetical protein